MEFVLGNTGFVLVTERFGNQGLGTEFKVNGQGIVGLYGTFLKLCCEMLLPLSSEHNKYTSELNLHYAPVPLLTRRKALCGGSH